MKTFEAVHVLGKVLTFDEATPPEWLTHKETLWFYNGHVLTLAVGASVETDFNTITRLS